MRAPILVEARAIARRSLDFVHDQFACGSRVRVLKTVNDVMREFLTVPIMVVDVGRTRIASARRKFA